MKTSNPVLSRVPLRALLFALIMLSSSICQFALSGGRSPLIYNDNDEVTYLKLPYLAYQQQLPQAVYYEHSQQHPLQEILLQPQGWLNWLVGAFASELHLRPTSLGLILDLVCLTLSYIAAVSLFRRLTARPLLPDALAVFYLYILFYVFTPQLEEMLPTVPLPEFLVSPTTMDAYKLPAVRGIYTQLSLPLFILASARLVDFLRLPTMKSALYLAALPVGLYLIYPFSAAGWLALAGFAVLLCLLLSKGDERRGLLASGGAFLGFALLGLLVVHGLFSGTDMRAILDPRFGDYWYFSLGELLIVCLLLFYAAGSRSRVPAVAVCAGALLAEYVCMNLQPLFGAGIAPYRMLGLYLRPLAGALIVLFIMEAAAARLRPRLGTVFVCFLPLVALFVRGVSGLLVLVAGERYPNLAELYRVIERQTAPDSVIAVSPLELDIRSQVIEKFPLRPLPNLVALETGRHLFFQNWVLYRGELQIEELQREYALGWLYFGDASLLWPCLNGVTEWPGDIFSLTWTYFQVARAHQCGGLKENGAALNLCEILRSYRLDYVIWDAALPFSKPKFYHSLFERVWASGGNEFELYRAKRERILDYVCN